MGRRPIQLAQAYLKALGLWGIAPFLAVSAAVLVAVPGIKISADLLSSLPENAYFSKIEQMKSRFSSSQFIVVSIQSDALYEPEIIRKIQEASDGLSRLEGVDSVVSVSTMSDLAVSEESIDLVPLIAGDLDNETILSMARTIESTPLFKDLLVSQDGSAWNIYVFPERNGTVEVRTVTDLLQSISPGRFETFGAPVLMYYLQAGIKRDVILLLACGCVVIFAMQWLFSRSVRTAGFLWLASVLPTLWVLGLFPIFGMELRLFTIFVPVEVLALSTSYGIHLLRYSSGHPSLSISEVLGHTSPIILVAAGSTMAGFATLLFSRVPELRALGAFSVAGVAFSLLSALFFLPVLLARCDLHSTENPGLASHARRNRGFAAASVLLGCGLIVVGSGMGRLRYGSSIGELFWARSKPGRAIQFFDEHHGGVEEVEIHLELPGEYPLVDLHVYEQIRRIALDLSEETGVNRVFAYTDVVEWGLGRMTGSDRPVRPESEADIGEMLELLASADLGMDLSSLVDATYSAARLRVRLNTEETGTKGIYDILLRLESRIPELVTKYLPTADFAVSGTPQEMLQVSRHVISGQFNGMLLFFPFLLGILLLACRRLRWAALCIVPSILGALFYLGLLGWTGIPLRSITGICLALVLGVSVDDAVYFSMFYRNQLRSTQPTEALDTSIKYAGAAIIQTTVIIVLELSVLLLSSYKIIAQVAVLAIGTLSFCTGVTFFFVPVVIRFYQARDRKVR